VSLRPLRTCLALAAAALLVAAAPAGAPPAAPGADREADPWFRSGREAVARVRALEPPRGTARNVILFVGDGMGPATVTAARILEGQLRGEPGEENLLSFEGLPYLALAKTYNTNQQVSDSAGTMTALVSGVKTKAGVLGVSDAVVYGDHTSVAESRVPTLLEEAAERGLALGIVTTTTLTHATPAALYAHVPQRDWEHDAALPPEARAAGFPDIARQFVEFARGDGIHVALGGGRRHFLPANAADPEEPERSGAREDGRDLVAEWQHRYPGGAYVWNLAQLEALDLSQTERLLGLFEPSHMNFEADRANDRAGEPSLTQMTTAAIHMLSPHPQGFFLMVEAGRIDHGHHAGNAYRALTETIELSNAVRAALALVGLADTLVVVTADHGHPLTIAGYPTRGNPIFGLVHENRPDGETAPARDALALPYTTLAYPIGPGAHAATDTQPAGPKRLPHFFSRALGDPVARPDLGELDTADPFHLQEAAVPRPFGTHGGEDVAIYAGGPGAELFRGVHEQHYVYHAIVDALGWQRTEGESDARPE
jgi:alkaline phosphatase